MGKVVLVDEDLRDIAAAGLEVGLDELAQIIRILREPEQEPVLINDALCKPVKLLELLGLVVARRDRPVEVVFAEDVQDDVVGEEGDLLRVKRPEEVRREVLVGGMLAANRQDELDETRNNVLPVARLRLCPKRRFRLVAKGKFGRGDVNAEVDVADNPRAVERAKPVGGDLVLQLLFSE